VTSSLILDESAKMRRDLSKSKMRNDREQHILKTCIFWLNQNTNTETTLRSKKLPNMERQPSRHMRWGRRTMVWKRTMGMILDSRASDASILLMLQTLQMSDEIRAQEMAVGADPNCRHGTLFHAAAVAGRINIATQLLRYGADPEALNFENQTPLDLALKHRQVRKRDISKWLTKIKQCNCSWHRLRCQNFWTPRKHWRQLGLNPSLREMNEIWCGHNGDVEGIWRDNSMKRS
jgi:hypothetical protein